MRPLHRPTNVRKFTTVSQMALLLVVLRRSVLLHALFSAWCVAQQRTGDGRVILNLGFFASYGGNFVSSGERTGLHTRLATIGARMHARPWAAECVNGIVCCIGLSSGISVLVLIWSVKVVAASFSSSR